MESIQVLGSRLSQSSPIASQRTFQWLTAKGISLLFSPPLLGAVSLIFLGLQLNTSDSWRWLAIYSLINLIAPVIYLLALLASGEVSDFHMSNRLERAKPLKAVLLLFFLSLLIFHALGAPTIFRVFALAGTLQSAAMFLITLRWKISGHAAGVAAFSVFLVAIYGPAAMPAFLFFPPVVWARLSLQRHDLQQSLAGGLLGAVTMGFAFSAISSSCATGPLLCV